jgi:hypothetical protein
MSADVVATGGASHADAAAAATASLTEEARKAAANFSIITAISLLVEPSIFAAIGLTFRQTN